MEPQYFESLYPAKTRFEEIKKVIEKIKSGRSAQVIGAPGVGKGSVLKLLPYNKSLRTLHLGKEEEVFHFVYMDFSEVKTKDLASIIKFILISISYSLTERGLSDNAETVNKFLKEALAIPDEMMLFQGLKKTIDFLANEKNITTVLLIDRFEDYIPNINPDFFSYLKILRNRAKYRFAVAVAATRPIEDTIDPALLSDFYEFLAGNIVYLALCDEIGLNFRLTHLEEITGRKKPKEIKDEIIALTGGQGKIARLSYEALLAFDADKPLRSFLLENKQVSGGLYEIWRFLTPEEKKDVINQNENHLLERLGLTKNGKITILLFEDFIKTAGSETNEKLQYDEARNIIKKGETDFGEQLSPSEFRLLRFLIKNSGRICEKDEIITNVWNDTKSQEGVTDQALDQIIYRLRKKIETDPKNPNIIQTIKGRGYKLSQ